MPRSGQQTFIALYGSLRRGQRPHVDLGLDRLLRMVGPCTLKGTLHDFGDWPGLVEGEGRVHAELYEVMSPDALHTLDGYEACDPASPERGLFIRRLVPLVEPETVSAFVYFYNRDPATAPVISCGDWVRHHGERTVQ